MTNYTMNKYAFAGNSQLAYDRTENVLYLVLTEKIVRSCLFNATFITIAYHVNEISVKSYHRNITTQWNTLDCIFFIE